MAVSLTQFLDRLADSGLMSPTDLQAFVAGLPAGQKPKDGRDLARLLVKSKTLTAFQVQQIFSGKGQSLVLGNYVILDKLGQGGMGLVLKAEHRRMKRVVALKILSPALMKTPEAVQRFQREVEAAAKLEHPHIVTAHDADEAGGTHFLVMQYVEGTDLSALVKEQGPLRIEKALPCILQAARGLEYAHKRGVVHRDIKPANLLLDSEGTIKVLDMGLARLESAGADQDQLTGTGQIMGTVDYMAPEQAMDTKTADARADIYSLGVTFWYLLTGRAVYEGDTLMAKFLAHREQAIPSLRAACPQVSPELEAVFAKMLAKTPETRYQSMTEVIAALDRCQGGAVSVPSFAVGPSEDSQLKAFLSGLETSPSLSAAGRTLATQTEIPVSGVEPTIVLASPLDDTDPQTQQTLRLSSTSGLASSAPLRKPWWQMPRAWIVGGCGAAALLLAGIIIKITTADGRVQEIPVPPGAKSRSLRIPRNQTHPCPSPPRKATPAMPTAARRSGRSPSAAQSG